MKCQVDEMASWWIGKLMKQQIDKMASLFIEHYVDEMTNPKYDEKAICQNDKLMKKPIS